MRILIDLQSREVLARVYADGKFYPAIKGRTLDTPIWPEYKIAKRSEDIKATKEINKADNKASNKDHKVDVRIRARANDPINLMRLFSSSEDGKK